MVELRIRVEKVEAAKLVSDETGDKEIVYRVNVSLNEADRTPGAVTLAFVLDINSSPAVARIQITGTATLVGTKSETQQLLAAPETNAPPPILAKIYERLYGTVYLLCDALQVTHPLPTLLRE